MRDIHTRAFKLYLMEQGRLPLDPGQQAELDKHLSSCSECRANAQLYRAFHVHARRGQQAAPSPPEAQSILENLHRRARRRRAALPLRLLAWTLAALLALAAVQWIFTNLRPLPAVLPLSNPTPDRATATPAPPTPGEDSGKIPVVSLLAGESAGWGIWSPGADYLFIPITEIPIPGSDRRSTRPHFIKASSGEDCPASKTFLGDPGYQNYAWLDGERVLFIDKNGLPLLFTACQDGFEDLGDRFDEPLTRIAMPVNFPELVRQGPLLLEGSKSYWLLDPAGLDARRLENPTPSPDLADSFAWTPAGDRISVLQPITGDSGTSRMFLLDLNTGEVLRSLVIETSDEGRAPMVEWMGPNQPFIWGFGTGGPLLVDLSSDPARQTHVLPELFGLDMVYPDQVFSMGAFHASEGGGFHLVVHTNLPDDRSIYVYHSENGQVEKIDGDRQVILILPGDQHMILAPLQDTPPYDDSYDLVWVDQPGNPQARVQVAGHSSRDLPNMASRLLPGGKRMLFGSSQGISLVGIPGGEILAFWRLAESGDYLFPRLYLTPGGQALIAVTNPGPSANGQSQSNLLYWIPLEAGGSP